MKHAKTISMPGKCSAALQGLFRCSRRLPYLTGARNPFSPFKQHLPLCFVFVFEDIAGRICLLALLLDLLDC